MATACRSWSFLWQPSLVGSREQMAGAAQGRVRSVSRPAPLLSLGNCCTKLPLTAGLNIREQCVLVHFPEISKGISESSRPAKPFCSLSYSQALHCCSSLCTWFLLCSSQHTHAGVWPLNQDTHVLQNCSFTRGHVSNSELQKYSFSIPLLGISALIIQHRETCDLISGTNSG